MLDEYNTHVKSFRTEIDRIKYCLVSDMKLRLISDRSTNGRIYNQPTIYEVVALIVGDVDTDSKIDILLESQSGRLKRISEFYPSYLAYQYPRLFPYREDGFRPEVIHRVTNKKRKQKEYAYHQRMAYI